MFKLLPKLFDCLLLRRNRLLLGCDGLLLRLDGVCPFTCDFLPPLFGSIFSLNLRLLLKFGLPFNFAQPCGVFLSLRLPLQSGLSLYFAQSCRLSISRFLFILLRLLFGCPLAVELLEH